MPHSATSIRDALETLVPTEVSNGVLLVDAAHLDQLHPEELVVVARAVDSRRSEFATGRVLLRRLTASSAAIPVASDRSPVLAPGWVASLAHAGPVVVAIASNAPGVVALGVDLEPKGAMSDEETALVRRSDDAPIDGRAVLVLKEAAYKAWSTLGGGLIDFHDMRIEVDGGSFMALVVGGTHLYGRWTDVADHWLAGVTVTR